MPTSPAAVSRARLAPLLVALVLAGCASSAGIAPRTAALDPVRAGVPVSADAEPVHLAIDWWRGFGDATLDGLVDRALAGHPDLQTAEARLERAGAAVAGTRAAQGPQVNGAVDLTRQRYSEHGLYPPPLAGSTRDSGTVQATGCWELDFFGRQRAELQSALGGERAARAELEAARLLLASRVTSVYVELARLLEQRRVAERSLAQREETLALIGDRVRAGLDTNVELRQGEGALPETPDRVARRAHRARAPRAGRAHRAAAGRAGHAGPRARRAARGHAAAQPAERPAGPPGRHRRGTRARRGRRPGRAGRQGGVLSEREPRRLRGPVVHRPGPPARGRQRRGRLRPGAAPAGLRQRPAARQPARQGGRRRRRRRQLQRRAARRPARRGRPAGRPAVDRKPAARAAQRAGRRRERLPARPAARYRAGLGSYLVVLSAESTVLAQRQLGVDLKARALDSQVQLIRALGGGYVAEPAPALASAPLQPPVLQTP